MSEYKIVEFVLPYPPSVNHLWRRRGRQIFLSSQYKEFLYEVGLLTNGARLVDADEYYVSLIVTPPDARRRDLDNVLKATFDAFTRSGLWQDDCKVAELHVYKKKPQKNRGSVRALVSVQRAALLKHKREMKEDGNSLP